MPPVGAFSMRMVALPEIVDWRLETSLVSNLSQLKFDFTTTLIGSPLAYVLLFDAPAMSATQTVGEEVPVAGAIHVAHAWRVLCCVPLQFAVVADPDDRNLPCGQVREVRVGVLGVECETKIDDPE